MLFTILFISLVDYQFSEPISISFQVEAPKTHKDLIISSLVSKPKAACYEEAIPAIEAEITKWVIIFLTAGFHCVDIRTTCSEQWKQTTASSAPLGERVTRFPALRKKVLWGWERNVLEPYIRVTKKVQVCLRSTNAICLEFFANIISFNIFKRVVFRELNT